ncbi:hypothetical protein RESH_02934 [Rhodopirellula europaea SH398]|uniref:Uncharacterized protein n=1 Tax=Rhodopirellula europaea SH398 TaxID=1263868 RepID=M5SJP4_9BACT|nr:hypothetical protein RESH_02934 [Rhodopirellula europaea SH398]
MCDPIQRPVSKANPRSRTRLQKRRAAGNCGVFLRVVRHWTHVFTPEF